MPDCTPGTVGPPACRTRKRDGDNRSDPNQLVPAPDALSHILTPRARAVRTPATAGERAATAPAKPRSQQRNGSAGLPPARIRCTIVLRPPHRKHPEKRVSPGQIDSAWGCSVGRVGLEPIRVTALTCDDAETTDIATRFQPAASSSIPLGWRSVRRSPHRSHLRLRQAPLPRSTGRVSPSVPLTASALRWNFTSYG